MTRTTNWNEYYSKPYKTAAYTRKITGNILVRLIRQYADCSHPIRIAELGGANSCFYDIIKREIHPAQYTVIDNNTLGLQRFEQRTAGESVCTLNADVLLLRKEIEADVVFSVGLIEHFSIENTARAIRSHFEIAREGGLLIISFPTPTYLYSITRFLSKVFGLWIFHDERALTMHEVSIEAARYGNILYSAVIWKVILTQGILVIRKK